MALGKIGGWLSDELIHYFADYAHFAFETFGDRVKTWITFNEPSNVCELGYEQGVHAPGIKDGAVKPYTCAHNILQSHAFAL